MAALSKLWIYGLSFAGIAGSNPTGVKDVCLSAVGVVCSQVEVSASCWSLVQRSPTECGVSECNLETLTMMRPWPTRGSRAIGKKMCYVRQELWGVVETQVSWELVKATRQYRQTYTYVSHKVHENSSRSHSLSAKDFFEDCCFSSPGRGGKFSPLWFRSNLHPARRWMGHEILKMCSVGIHLTVTSSASNWETLRLRKEGSRNLIASNC